MKEIKVRRSIRTFIEDKKVSRESMETLIRAAMQAPSAMNRKPWCFMVIDEEEVMKKLMQHPSFTGKIKEAKAFILVLADLEKATCRLFHQDLAAATQNILLEATHMGIGSYWIGVYETDNRLEAVKEIFNLPTNIEPFSLVALGYPKSEDDFYFRDNFDASLIKYNGWE
ncbi:MAG: nitroreductase family protein [Bacilli bacterium]|nr:nitroreductase family protein [Bacilli bacterium]